MIVSQTDPLPAQRGLGSRQPMAVPEETIELGQGAQQGGFAAARWAQKANELALLTDRDMFFKAVTSAHSLLGF